MDAVDLVPVKSEPASPQSLSQDRKSPSTKCLDPVEKWRTRVLFCQPKLTTESWAKKIEKQMAVLKVAFPFLTERQIRGKAWKCCGFNSVMGSLPRSGLSPEIKKEFIKPRYNRFRMSKSKVKKEKIKVESDNCPYIFISSKTSSDDSKNYVQTLDGSSLNSESKRLSNNLNTNLVMSGLNMLSRSSNSEESNIFDKSTIVIQETPESSLSINSPAFEISYSFSHISKLAVNNEYFTDAHITECTSTSQCAKSRTVSNLDTEMQYLKSSHILNDSGGTQDSAVNSSIECFNTPKKFKRLQNNSDISSTLAVNNEYFTETQITECTSIFQCDKSRTISNLNKEIQYSKSSHILNDSGGTQDSAVNSSIECFNTPKKFIRLQNNSDISYHRFNNILPTPEINDLVPSINKNSNSCELLSAKNICEKSVEGYQHDFCIPKDNILKRSLKCSSTEENLKTMSLVNTTAYTPKSLDLTNLFIRKEEIHKNSLNSNIVQLHEEMALMPTNSENKLRNNNTNFSMEIDLLSSLISTPFTQGNNDILEELPPDISLSNYCMEHNKAYAKVDFKPIPCRNYYLNKVNQSLKRHFDNVISPEKSLNDFFKASSKTFEEIETVVHEIVDNILLKLEDY